MPSRSMKLLARKGVKRQRNTNKFFQKKNEVLPGDDEPTSSNKRAASPTTTSSPANKKFKNETENEFLQWFLHTSRYLEKQHKHQLFPAFNVNTAGISSLDELREYPGCELSVVQPVHVAAKHCEHIDLCHRRSLARECYEKRLQFALTRYQAVQKSCKEVRRLEKDQYYHISLYHLAERLERDPDPYFHGNYDYYYTGGNVCTLPGETDNFIVHADDDNLQNLNASQLILTHDSPTVRLQSICSRVLPTADEIFQVLPLRIPHMNGLNCFGVRQRNSVTLYGLHQRKKRLKAITQFNTADVPFISFAQSVSDANIFLTSSMKQQVHCYDLNVPTPTLTKIYNLNRDEHKNIVNWNTLQSWHEQTFLYANERELYCMDLRTKPSDWHTNVCGFSNDEFVCELISMMRRSKYDNLVYVGTSHKLHCLDVRKMPKHFEAEGAVCRWTHQLEYAPAFIDTIRADNSEFLAYASALPGDVRICELNRQANLQSLEPGPSNYSSYCLPYQPPILQDAYENARQAGLCLQPEADLARRVRCCTTGLSICESYKSPRESAELQAVLLLANSNGDVYAQRIRPRETQTAEPRSNALSNELMAEYAAQICRVTQSQLMYTEVSDLSVMSKVFLCSTLSKSEKDEKSDLSKLETHRRRLGRWQKSVRALHKYKDALARDLLGIWDVECDEEKDIKLRQLSESLRVKPDPENIVSSWLNSTANMSRPSMVSIPMNNLNASYFNALDESTTFTLSETLAQEFEGVPQSTQIADETLLGNETPGQQQQKQQTINKTKTAKKKNKYIKGF